MAVLLSSSGASTAGAFVGACAVTVAQNVKFDYFCGVSYSAVIGLPLVLKKYDAIKQLTTNLKHKDFFKVAPMTEKGKLTPAANARALASLFFPKKIKSFGLQDVRPILAAHVSEYEFEQYQDNAAAPVVYVVAVNADTQAPVVWNLKNKDINYQGYLDRVAASSRIPVWTQPQEIDGVDYYDGGVTDTNAAALILDMNRDIKKCFSIYPRPKGFKGKIAPPRDGIAGAIAWTIDTMLKDVSKNDEQTERQTCKELGVKLAQIFPNKYLLTNLYDTDRARLLELWALGVKITENSINEF